MSPSEFKAKLAECRTEMEARRVVLWFFGRLDARTTAKEKWECLQAAEARAEALSMEEFKARRIAA